MFTRIILREPRTTKTLQVTILQCHQIRTVPVILLTNNARTRPVVITGQHRTLLRTLMQIIVTRTTIVISMGYGVFFILLFFHELAFPEFVPPMLRLSVFGTPSWISIDFFFAFYSFVYSTDNF